MKQLLLSFLLCTSLFGFGQCPTTDLIFNSQAQLNAFAINYPNCASFNRFVEISGSDITDLSPLSGLTFISDLHIIDNPLLTSLDGLNLERAPWTLLILNNATLNNIASLQSIINTNNNVNLLDIFDNPVLMSLNGLQSLGNFVSTLRIANNDSLTNLIGLENFLGINELYIENNDNLINFEGLSLYEAGGEYFVVKNNASLVSFDGLNMSLGIIVDEFTIEDNPSLTDISTINDFVLVCFEECTSNAEEGVITGRISIRNNTELSICNYASICQAMEVWNPVLQPSAQFTIENNAEGCNSFSQVASECGLVPRNDDCNGALTLTIGEILQAYNQLATTSTETPSCEDIDRADVWFTFNSGTNATIDILVDEGYNIQLWEGTCGALTQVPNSCSIGSLTDFSVATNTDYYVQVWSCSTCRLATGLFTIQVQDGTLSTSEVSIDNDVKLYPNPVKNTLNINATNSISHIEVYNTIGQNVVESYPNSLATTLEFSALKSGIYFVKVESDGKMETFKVVNE